MRIHGKLFPQTTLQMCMMHKVRKERRVLLCEFGIYALAGCVFGVITSPRTTEVAKALEEHR
jgi:hypothetical protein